jgi:uncharacterized protein YndB with AHSA1/START domain
VIVDRPVRLVFTWGWTDPGFGLAPGTSRVEVALTRSGEDGQQTRLRLVQTGLAGDPAAYPSERPAGRLNALHRQRAGKDSS